MFINGPQETSIKITHATQETIQIVDPGKLITKTTDKQKDTYPVRKDKKCTELKQQLLICKVRNIK